MFSSGAVCPPDDRKTFSAATIKSRMLDVKRPLKDRIRRVYNDYKNVSKQISKLDEKALLKELLYNDLMFILSSSSSDILGGKSLTSILGLSTFSQKTKSLAVKFSVDYRRALNQISRTGTITSNSYSKLDSSVSTLVDSMVGDILGEEFLNSLLVAR